MWFLCARDNTAAAFHEALTASTQRKCLMVIMAALPASSFCALTSCRSVFEWMATEEVGTGLRKVKLLVPLQRVWRLCVFLLSRSKEKRKLQPQDALRFNDVSALCGEMTPDTRLFFLYWLKTTFTTQNRSEIYQRLKIRLEILLLDI